MLLVTLLWAMGGFTPFYRLVYAIVPGTKFFRAPSTILFIVTFSICLLAAVGAERLLSAQVSRKYLLIWLGAAALIGLLASAGFFTGLGTLIMPERAEFVRRNAGAVMLGGWRSFCFVALAVGAAGAGLQRRIAPPAAAMLLCGIVGLDLWTVVRQYWKFSPAAAELYASDATIEYMKSQPQPGRVLPLALQDPYTRDPFLKGDALMVHEVRNAEGYHGNHLANYESLMGQRVGNPRFWQLANVRYLLSDKADLGLPVLVGPVTNAYGTTVFLYQLPGENPLAWVTPVIVKAPDEQVLGTLYHERFDPRTAALFDLSATVTARTDLQQVPEPLDLKASVTQFAPGRIAVELERPAPAGSALVVSENYYPGWSAAVDGKSAPIGRADLSLIGVELPEGARQVELTFRSASYEQGRRVTLAALVLTVIITAGGMVTARKRSARPENQADR
jgi:hypothetical protein